MNKFYYSLLLCFCFIIQGESKADIDVNPSFKIDSLTTILSSTLSDRDRLDALHKTCAVLYKEDSNHVLLSEYAKEGVALAKKLKDTDKGADLAVWILRANIYLRSYHRNPPYYSYLDKLYKAKKIEKKKIIQPLYSEIYSYLDYGKLRDAETKLANYEALIDKSDPKQMAYYLDMLSVFQRKAKDYLKASKALEEFTAITEEIDDKRFLVMALSRNGDFYLVDSLDYRKSEEYFQKALEAVDKHEINQFKQHILLQLATAQYKLEEMETFKATYKKVSVDSFSKDNKILHKDYYTFSGDLSYDNGDFEQAKSQYKQAMQYLEMDDFSTMEILTKKLEQCYLKQKNFKKAFLYSNRLNVLKDSLFTVQKVQSSERYESKLKFKDAETQKIKLQNKISEQKRSTIFIGFFSSLLLIGLLFYNRILDEKVNQRTLALDTKNKELQSSIKELEQFSFIASHDIKEPMRVVSSVTGLIEMKLKKEKNNKYNKEFNLVKNSITQLYTLIEDLSQFIDFKSNTVTHQIIDTNLLASQVKGMLSKKINEVNGTVNFDQLPKIYSSNSLLTVIFKNLIENGLKYNDSESPKVDITYKQAKGLHTFTFKDNGQGIDPKYHTYIFEMFKRLERGKNDGSGLGLGLVSKSVEKLDGSITLDSSEGNGSAFTVSLPMSYVQVD